MVKGKLNIKAIEGRRAANTPSGDKNVVQETERFQNAVTGALDALVPAIQVIKEDLIAVTGAIYGNKSINESTKYNQLLGSLSTVNILQTPIKGLVTKFDDFTKNSDKLLTSTNEILKSIPQSFAGLLAEYYNSENSSKPVETVKTEVQPNVEQPDLSQLDNIYAYVSTTLQDVIQSNNPNKLLSDIYDVLSIDIRDALGVSYADQIDNFKLEVSTYLNTIESVLKNKSEAGTETSNGEIKLIVEGLDNDKLDSLVKLTENQINPNTIFSADIDFTKTIKALQEIDKLNSFSAILKKTDINKDIIKAVNNYTEFITCVARIFNDLSTLEDSLLDIQHLNQEDIINGADKLDALKYFALVDIDWLSDGKITKGILGINDFAEALNTIDVFKLIDSISDLSELSALSDDKFSWLNDETIFVRLNNISAIGGSLSSSYSELVKLGIYASLINSVKSDLIDSVKTMYTFLYGRRKGEVSILKILDSASDLNLQNAKSVIDALDIVRSITHRSIKVGLTVSLAKKALDKAIEFLTVISDNKAGLYKAVNKLPNFSKDEDKLTAIDSLFKAIRNLAVTSSLMLVLFVPAILGLYAAVKFIEVLNETVGKINTACDPKQLKQTQESATAFAKFLIVISGLVLLAAVVGTFLLTNIVSIMAFATILAGFMLLTVGAFNLASKGVRNALKDAEQFTTLLVTSTILLFVGAFTGMWLASHIVNIALFTLTLSAFIFAVTYSFTAGMKNNQAAMKGAKDFTILLAVSAGILLLAGKILSPGDIFAAFGFAVVLTAFIASMVYVYDFAQRHLRKSIKALKDFVTLVAASAGVLLIGAAFMMIPGMWLNSLLFAVELTAFIFAVTWAYSYNTKTIAQSLRYAPAFAILVAVSAITLLIGGYFILQNPLLVLSVLAFGALLAGFIFAVTWAYSKNAKEIGQAFLPAIGLAVLVALSGAILIFAATTLTWEEMGKALVFGLTLGVFALIMGGACKILSKMGTNVFIGLAILAGINLIVAMAAWSFGLMANTVAKFGGAGTMLESMGAFSLAISVLAGIAAIVGIPAVAALVALGEVVMLGLVGIIALAAKAMNNVADAMIKLKSIGKFEAEPIKDMLVGFCDLVGSLTPLANPLTAIKISKASKSTMSLSATISSIAKAVQDYSSLTVPEITDGKVTGVRKLDRSDFKEAAKNVKMIISTLGTAIIELYDEKPEIFETEGGIFGLGSKSKFSIVCQSCESLGRMLAKIAKGVKNYASLVVPEYTGTKITGYRSLDKNDFKEASKNVKMIISTLGGAIIELYDEEPELFETEGGILGFGAKSKFSIVVNSCTDMAKMISKIAKSVKDYASLQIPEYTGTEITGYRTLDESDFTNAANNIKTIISTLGGAIIELYDEAPELFETEGGILGFGSKSKFSIVVQSCTNMAKMISKIAESVKDYASLNVPIYEGTTVTGYRALNDSDFKDAANNVKTIITTLGQAIIDTYNNAPEGMFNGTGIFGLGSTPFDKVVKSCTGTGNMISQIAQAIKDYASFQVPEYDENGRPTGNYKQLTTSDFDQASHNIALVISTIGKSMMDTYAEHKEWFDDPSWFGNTLEGSPFSKVLMACTGMGNMISQIAQGVKDYAQLTIEEFDPVTGKTTGEFRKMDPNDFKEAAATIGSLISCIGGALMAVFGEHNDWFEDPSWFGSKAERTPFGMLMASTKGMGALVSEVAKSVTDVANLTMKDPATGEDIKMTINDITKTGEVISKMFTAIGGALLGSYDKYKKNLFDNKGKILDTMDNSINKAVELLNNTSSCLNKVLNIKIGDGIVNLSMFDTNNENSIPSLISNIIKVIPNSVYDAYVDTIKTQSITSDMISAYDDLVNLFEYVQSAWKTVSNICTPEGIQLVNTLIETNALNKMIKSICESTLNIDFDTEDIVEQKLDTIEVIGDIISEIAAIYKSDIPNLLDNDVQKNAKIMGNKTNPAREAIRIIAEMFKDVKFTDPGSDISVKMKNYSKAVDAVGSVYTSIGDILTGLGIDKIQTVKTIIPDMYDPIKSFALSIINSKVNLSKLTDFNDNAEQLIAAVKTMLHIVRLSENINVNNMSALQLTAPIYVSALKSLGDSSLTAEHWNRIIALNEHFSDINAVVSSIIRVNNSILDTNFSGIDRFEEIANEYKLGVITMAEAYDILANVATKSNFSNILSSIFNTDNDTDVLTKSLKGVNEVIEGITEDGLQKFHTEVTDLDAYTKSINSIDIAKTNALTKLTESLNELAYNMGNLDGLTEAVAIRLSGVLEKLTAELNNTKDTFNTAERIQKERYEYISNTIKKVENTMAQPLMVKVGLADESTTDYSSTNRTTGGSGSGHGSFGTVVPGSTGNQTDSMGGGTGQGGMSITPEQSRSQSQYNHTYEPSSNQQRYDGSGVRTESVTNFNNLQSTLRSTVKSVFEEMINKYQLGNNGARGTAATTLRR